LLITIEYFRKITVSTKYPLIWVNESHNRWENEPISNENIIRIGFRKKYLFQLNSVYIHNLVLKKYGKFTNRSFLIIL
jgi:hypothetical protein